MLSTEVHGRLDGFGAPLYRGELNLSLDELALVNARIMGSGFRFEEVVEGPVFGPKSVKPESAGKVVSTPTTAPRLLPQKRAKIELPVISTTPRLPAILKPSPNPPQMIGWRVIISSLIDSLLAEVSRDGIGYWFKNTTPPEIVDGVQKLPTSLIEIKKKVADGTFTSHFDFQEDLSTLTEFVFSHYSIYSTPFSVAAKLRRASLEALQSAVSEIPNSEYYDIPMPASDNEEEDDFPTPRSSVTGAVSRLSNVTAKPLKPIASKKSSLATPPEQQNALMERIAALEEEVARARAGGFEKPMNPEEISKLEKDIGALTAANIQKLVGEKLRGQPGLSFQGVGADRETVIEISRMPAKLQRNVRRFVTQKLNEQKGAPSMEKLRRLAKDDSKARENEVLVEKMLADKKRKREEQGLLKRTRSESSSSADSIDREELARLRELKQRDDEARRMFELMALDGGDDANDLD